MRKSYFKVLFYLIYLVIIVSLIFINVRLTKINRKIDAIEEYLLTQEQSSDVIIENYYIYNNEDISQNEEETIETKNIYTEVIDNLSDYDKELICRVLYREAGGEEEDGQRAVVEVILNRLLSEKYPNTIEEVLSQENQFSTWIYRAGVSEENIANSALIIEKVYNEENSILNEEYVYFNSLEDPIMNNRRKIGNHWFGTN